MLRDHIVLAVLWIVYCVLHSVLASAGIKSSIKQWSGQKFKYYRLSYTLFALIFLVALVYWQLNLNTVLLFERGTILLLIGITITLAGLSLMIVCIKRYFMSLSGLESLWKENPSNQLIISGVHRYVRHPLYLGTFVFIWGLLIVLPYLSWLISSFVITAYTIIAIEFEEQKLVDEFGEAYIKYQKSVPKLLPRLKSSANKHI